ncbi:MAG: penicillin acylase family protein [Bacteroidetes bacterium]|nr:penicillin acylase family protein [Bacteroidota bacterium]
MKKKLRIVLRFLVVTSALLLFGLGAIYLSQLPDYDFLLESGEVSSEVEILFDEMAVPHIYAETEDDAMFALGYVHASERLWQMDLLRRAGAGELSALLGKDMVENDQYLRTLGMREAAIKTAAAFETDAPIRIRKSMDAYLKGINAFVESGNRPFEYHLVGEDPAPFTTEDVFCSTGFMAYSFAIHLKTEPILDWMLHALDAVYMNDLAWGQEGFVQIPVDRVDMLPDISGLANRVFQLDDDRPVPQWLGSNAWVLSGDRTASGEVLFCNDAHMAYASPSVWYEAHIVTPELEYYGNHLAGLPFPAIGHTRDHAWGITMFVNDDIDLYREEIQGDLYRFGEEWRPLERIQDTIFVAGGEPVTFDIVKTHHGPIVEDDLAMWWTYTQYPENRIHEAFYGFSRGSGIEEFQSYASLVHAPGINLMYGDRRGDIGWWASAKLPVRPNQLNTKVAIDGTNPSNDPSGWHPFSANPQLVNPARGFVYSANNAPEPMVDSIGYPGHYYSGNTRAAGIYEALSAPKNDWTISDAQAIQLDHHSRVYAENAAIMVELAEAAGQSVPILKDWDGAHRANDVAPTLYYRWMYRTIRLAMLDEFERAIGETDSIDAKEKFESWHRTIVSENTFPRLLRNLDSPWWDDVRTDDKESAGDIVVLALKEAKRDLQSTFDGDSSHWHYGRLHTATHRHAMTDVPVLGEALDVGPFELPSAKDALNKYEFKLKEAVDFEIFSGPSMRISIDFSDVASSESILPTGQSGNPFSPFYDNQAALYHAGQFRKQRMDRPDIEEHRMGTSRIIPDVGLESSADQ